MAIRKLRQASLAAEDEQEEAATSLVTREVLKRKALEIVAQILVPSDVLCRKQLVKLLKLLLKYLKTCNNLWHLVSY